MANCRDCNREIIYAKSDDTGRFIPVDARPLQMFTLGEGDGTPIAKKFTPEAGVRVYTSHFQTCPSPEKFSKGRGGA